jgi:hypothetical protein
MQRLPVSLSVIVDGRRHDGFYAVQSRMLTVWSPALGSRTAWLEAQDPALHDLAQALLMEVVTECEAARLRSWSYGAACRNDSPPALAEQGGPPDRHRAHAPDGLRT